MNLTFLQSIGTRNFLLVFFFRVGNKLSISVDIKLFKRAIKSAREPNFAASVTVKRVPIARKTQTHKLRKNVGRHFEIENFHHTRCWLDPIAHTHTHTRSHHSSHARTRVLHETQWRRPVWCHGDTRDRLLCGVRVCVTEHLSVSRTTGTHVTFPSRNSTSDPNKRQRKKKRTNGVRVQCFRFALGSPYPIDPSSHRRSRDLNLEWCSGCFGLRRERFHVERASRWVAIG